MPFASGSRDGSRKALLSGEAAQSHDLRLIRRDQVPPHREKGGAAGTHSASRVPNLTRRGLSGAVFSAPFFLSGVSQNSLDSPWFCQMLPGPPQPPLSILLSTVVLSPQTQFSAPIALDFHSSTPPTPWDAALTLCSAPPGPRAHLASEASFSQRPRPPRAQKLGVDVGQLVEGSSRAFLTPTAHPPTPRSAESLLW